MDKVTELKIEQAETKEDQENRMEEPVREPVLEEYQGFVPEPEKILKAIIFASPDFVSLAKIREIMGDEWQPEQIRDAIKKMNQKLAEEEEPFEIAEAANGFRYRTRAAYQSWVRQLFKDAGNRRLSQAALEMLSLVAYKQPITKAELEDVRGVNVDGVLKGLLDRKMVTILGKSEKAGNAYEYGTTKEFLQYFGLNRVPQDLPKLSEFEDLIQATSLIPQFAKTGELIDSEQNEVEEDTPSSDEVEDTGASEESQ